MACRNRFGFLVCAAALVSASLACSTAMAIPIIDAGGPYEFSLDDPEFTLSASAFESDPAATLVLIEWLSIDPVPPGSPILSIHTGDLSPTFASAQFGPGFFTITLRVTNSLGQRVTDDAALTVTVGRIVQTVPEPATFLMLAAAALLMVSRQRGTPLQRRDPP